MLWLQCILCGRDHLLLLGATDNLRSIFGCARVSLIRISSRWPRITTPGHVHRYGTTGTHSWLSTMTPPTNPVSSFCSAVWPPDLKLQCLPRGTWLWFTFRYPCSWLISQHHGLNLLFRQSNYLNFQSNIISEIYILLTARLYINIYTKRQTFFLTVG